MIGISLEASGDNHEHDVSIDTTEAANECAGSQRPQEVSLSALAPHPHTADMAIQLPFL